MTNKRLINLETGYPAQYIEGETHYSPLFWELVEGGLTDEMMFEIMREQMEQQENIEDED